MDISGTLERYKRGSMHTSSHQHSTTETLIEFPDNTLLQQLVGIHNAHLKRLEKKFDLKIHLRGNVMSIVGDEQAIKEVESLLQVLYQKLQEGDDIDSIRIDDQVSKKMTKKDTEIRIRLKTEERTIVPRNQRQVDFVNLLQKNELVFALGPAGTGKTYMAVAMGVSLLLAGKVSRIILSRPAIEAGEKLGFLPGDMKEKVDPYLRPLYDALHDMIQASNLEKLMNSEVIEVAPLAFMRGRTLSHSYIILDEAQNTTVMQMKMFLTRLGEGSRMVVTGDMSQIDLPAHQQSGLVDAAQRFHNIPSIGFMTFGSQDVVRHPLVARIADAYDKS